jgi:hypothetical protein
MKARGKQSFVTTQKTINPEQALLLQHDAGLYSVGLHRRGISLQPHTDFDSFRAVKRKDFTRYGFHFAEGIERDAERKKGRKNEGEKRKNKSVY